MLFMANLQMGGDVRELAETARNFIVAAADLV
jgi:hypothetical protein